MPLPPRALPMEVTWMEPGTSEDAYGNDVDDFAAGTSRLIRAWIQQDESTEQRDGRDTVTSRWLILTNELDLTAKARIIWNGATYVVDGQPEVMFTPQGAHHLEAHLLRVDG